MTNKKWLPTARREGASELVGAWHAAMWTFAQDFNYLPTISHLECVEEKWGRWPNAQVIKEVHICGAFSPDDDENEEELKDIYKKFYEWLKPLVEHCKLPSIEGVVLYFGFNYSDPGLIILSQAGFWYDDFRNLLDMKSTGTLYTSLDDLERGEAIEDKAWDAFMTSIME